MDKNNNSNREKNSQNQKTNNKREYKPRNENRSSGKREDRPKGINKSRTEERSYKERGENNRSFGKREDKSFRGDNKSRSKGSSYDERGEKSQGEGYKSRGESNRSFDKKENRPYQKNNNFNRNKPFRKRTEKPFKSSESKDTRLNKFIANAGICSRREADVFIASGNVQVNGEVVSEMGYKVKPSDEVRFDGKVIKSEKKEYLLLNKPKGFITTTADEKGRKTVMDLIANATKARLVPVGRLDRPTTGLLLFTNDGDLAKKLTHPSHEVRKIYHVVLDKKLEFADLKKIEEGLELEDGHIEVDEISYIEKASKNEVGVKIHSGRNRIVRRIFEHLGYQVERLDRVVFAGLTKKDLPRGHWRHLTEQEVINLKNIR